MKKLFIILSLVIITFGNFISVCFAGTTVGQNGAGFNGGGSGGGVDTCKGSYLYCPRGWIKVVAYRLTFVYALGGNYKMPVNADDSTKKVDSLDVWAEAWRISSAYNYTKVKYITGNGSRMGVQASKIEYVWSIKTGTKTCFGRVLNSTHKSTYVQGIEGDFVTDSQLNPSLNYKANKRAGLNKFVDNYDGRGVMEYFSGAPNTGNPEVDYSKLVDLARKMHVIKKTDGLEELGKIAKLPDGDSNPDNDYVLKLLIEPISQYMASDNNWIGGFFTATELALIMKGKVNCGRKYSVRENDKNRSRCVFPLRGFLVENDVELGFNAYTGSRDCSKTSIDANTIFYNLGVMVVDLTRFYKDELCDPTVECCDPPCDKSKVVFRTISLTNPFPGYNGSGRTPGDNWLSKDESDTPEDETNTLINNYILNNRSVSGGKVYDLTPMYKITLTPTLIEQIREYNSKIADGYSDDSLIKCDDDDNPDCVLPPDRVYQSTFVHTTFKNSFSGCIINGACIIPVVEQEDLEE